MAENSQLNETKSLDSPIWFCLAIKHARIEPEQKVAEKGHSFCHKWARQTNNNIDENKAKLH